MKNKTTILLLLAILVAPMLACALSAIPTLMPASTPPALPQYVAPTPTPTYAPLPRMNPGDSVTVTDGSGKLVWIEYLGNSGGYDSWNCVSNAPGRESDCKSSDLEVHQNFFYWGSEQIGWNGDDGYVHLYKNWHITTSAEKPTMP